VARDNYLILFGDEAPNFEKAYTLSDLLPGYRLLGLTGWDNFIIEDGDGARFSVPTVPVLRRCLSSFALGSAPENLTPDNRFHGRIKWYITPVAFGGDPSQGDNVTWVSLDQHAQLVRFWNRKYRALARDT